MLRWTQRPIPTAWLQDSALPAKLRSPKIERDAQVQYEIGLAYLQGTTVVENVRLAGHWLLGAAETGRVEGSIHTYAEFLLATLVREGEGLPLAIDKYLKHLARAARAGFAPAQMELGCLHTYGDLTLPRNPARGRALLLQAAKAGDITAMKDWHDKALKRRQICVLKKKRIGRAHV
eukprot:TRINITY_DN87688_c0_g1_i1.p1 TRINITY_DN87688_c0_g1~~TRINITY_DN87688_c0_g1_i1.p1  ORF type:complete len:177 (+),score=21.48 TRINITY_DN87688_c0_g1_i1:188-718(+)